MKNAIMDVTVIFIMKESTTVPCAMLYHVHLVLLMDCDVLKRIALLGSVANIRESIARIAKKRRNPRNVQRSNNGNTVCNAVEEDL